MKKYSALGIIAALLVISVPSLALADIGIGSWRFGVFDGDSYVNTPSYPASTSTPELLGVDAKNGSSAPAWYFFDSNFSINASSPPGFNGGGPVYQIQLNAIPDTDIGNLTNDYVSTSTLASTVSSISMAIGNISSGLTLAGVTAFMSNQATTSQLIASSTFNGFMSSSTASTIANLKTVATSGSYNDLTSKPSIGVAYEGTTLRTAAFPIFKSATVSSGTAVFNLTADGTSGGTALCTNGVIQDSVSTAVSDALASYQMSWAFTNSNKTLTVTTNKLTTANILTGVLGQAAANGSVVKVSVWCY